MTNTPPRLRKRLWPVGKMCTTGCATTLERSVAKLPGVTRAQANFSSGTLMITYDPASLAPAAIARAIRAEGFSCADEPIGDVKAQEPVETPHSALPAQGKTSTPERQDGLPHQHPDSSPAKGAAGSGSHDAHEGMHHGSDLHAAARDMQRRFLVALAFGIPLFVWSPMGLFEPPPVPFGLGKQIWLFLIASGALLYPGWPFYTAAIRSLRHGVLDMAVLVLLSVGTGYLFSLGATFLFEGADFYEATSVLLIFILLGHWLEMRARAGASDAMKSLLKLSPPRALVRRGAARARPCVPDRQRRRCVWKLPDPADDWRGRHGVSDVEYAELLVHVARFLPNRPELFLSALRSGRRLDVVSTSLGGVGGGSGQSLAPNLVVDGGHLRRHLVDAWFGQLHDDHYPDACPRYDDVSLTDDHLGDVHHRNPASIRVARPHG